FGSVERFARLIDVRELDRRPDLERTTIGLFLPDQHAKQRRLAGAVRADHADDAAAPQRKREVVDQRTIAVALAEMLRFDYEIAEACSGRNRYLQFFLARVGRLRFGNELVVRVDARLALGLPRARRHAHPFELAFQCAATRLVDLLFLGEPLLFL